MNTTHLKIITLMFVVILGIQSITAQNWPVKNNNYCVTQGFCGTFFGFHPAIDIHDFNTETNYFKGSSDVVAVRGGTIEYVQQTSAGIALIIKHIDGVGNIEYDLYLHLGSLEVLENIPVDGLYPNIPIAEGEVLSKEFEGGIGGPHLHFSRLNKFVDNKLKPGYAEDYSNILNPLYIFGEHFDPQDKKPQLIDTDGKGKIQIIDLDGNLLFSDKTKTEPVFGDVDILAEAHDQQETDELYNSSVVYYELYPGNTKEITEYFHAPQVPVSIGYWIENVSNSSISVRKKDEPYILCNFGDEWFPNGGDAFFSDIVNNDVGWPSNYFIVTNTKGTTGLPQNVDANQFWRTRAKKQTGSEPNRSDAELAKVEAEAVFPDGTYRIWISMKDLNTANDNEDFQDIELDNFAPFIRKVEGEKDDRKKRGNNTIYLCEWLWNESDYEKQGAIRGIITPNDQIHFTVTASEPLKDLYLSIPELNIENIQFTPVAGSNYLEWTCNSVSLSNANTGLVYSLSFTGHDKAGNPLQHDPNRKPVRTSETGFTPALTTEPDENHSIYIIPTSKVALVIDRSGSMASKTNFEYYYGSSRWDEWSGYLQIAKDQTKNFIGKLNNSDEYTVVSFASNTTIKDKTVTSSQVNVPFNTKQNNLMIYSPAIDNIFALGGTSIGAGAQEAIIQLDKTTGSKYMVILSDGMENTQPYATDINFGDITVITMGLGPKSDFEKLNQIATGNGIIVKKKKRGRDDDNSGYYVYSHDSLSFMNLMSQINSDVTGRQVISSKSGYLNGSITEPITVDGSQVQTVFSVSWANENNPISFSLISPNGNTVEADNNHIIYNRGTTFCSYTVNSPEKGEWQISLSGSGNEPYNISVSSYTGLSLNTQFDKDEYASNESIITVAEILNDNAPVIDAQVMATISFSAAGQDGSRQLATIELFDDGNHNDLAAGDGIYGCEFSQTEEAGNYTYQITATGKNQSIGNFNRTVTKTTIVVPVEKELTLNIPADFESIQEAIDSAYNAGGGTVRVTEGVYNENLTIYDKVWVISEGDPARTLIEGNGKSDVITLKEVFDGGIIGFTITGSKKNGNAAGIKCTGEQTPVIANCIIKENRHGMFVAGNIKAIIGNNTFVENKGDGIRIVGNSPSIMFNNIFTENETGIETKGQAVDAHGYNNFWNNKTDFTGINAAKDDVFANPLFVDKSAENYTLQATSPCVNAGHENLPDTDGSRSDIGAYGGLFSYWRNMFISESTVIEGSLPYYIIGKTDISLQFEPKTKKKSTTIEGFTDSLVVNQINRHLFLQDDVKSIGKFWVIRSTNTVTGKDVVINYSDEAVFNNKLDESLLKIAFYDIETKQWKTLSTKVDANSNTVTANISNMNGYWTIIESTDVSGIDETKPEISQSNLVGRVYPNPADANINIPLNLANRSEISVEIFDIKGRLTATILSNQLFDKGKYAIEWNTSAIKTSGLYLLKITINGIPVNRNVMIMK